jgi:hypothetical protein
MVTVRCKTCGAMHQMGHCSPAEYPFCGPDCEAAFERVVELLANNAPLDVVGVEEGSRLWREAMQEVSLREARERWQGRAQLEIDYYASRPRGLPNVAKRYFSF